MSQKEVMSMPHSPLYVLTRLADGFGPGSPTSTKYRIHPKNWFPRFRVLPRNSAYENGVLYEVVATIIDLMPASVKY